MDAYVEITLRPDPEFGTQVLLDALMNKLHRGLAQAAIHAIGISFPAYRKKPRTLGDRLRLHGHSPLLAEFMASPWLSGMADHLHVSDVRPVPADAQFRIVRRVQPKTSVARLRRRYLRRHHVSEEEARQRISNSVESAVSLPFVTLHSATTAQRFALFIEQGPITHQSTPGTFSTYGLSPQATVPWF